MRIKDLNNGQGIINIIQEYSSVREANFLLPVLPAIVLMEIENPSEERELLTYLVTYSVRTKCGVSTLFITVIRLN